ncbi:MAG: hypothetical protein A2X22_13920 [Bacteroidetes bacterium GWF2_49_14]|nr:MAG: hypothetical protein A2X22_13920 [Bacteroidetes bacterium GWF2_49_14]HBB91741.1 hypothetical protein [Bacteroidales bacterium]
MRKRLSIEYFAVLALILAGQGCRNDIDLVLSSDPIPVVYGIISPDDSIHRIYLTQSINPMDSPGNLTAAPFVVTVPEADVFLELRTPEGLVIERSRLRRVQGLPRMEGIFRAEPNVHYECAAMNIIDPAPGTMVLYTLTVALSGNPHFLYAETEIPPEPSLQFGKGLHTHTPVNLFPEQTENEISIYLPDTLWTEFHVVVHYFEKINQDWQHQSIRYKRNYPAVIRNSDTRTDHFNLDEGWFFTLIINNIKKDPLVQARRFDHMEFGVTYASRAFNDYYRSIQYESDLDNSLYSNIVSGMGLFCASNSRHYSGFMLNPRSLDSLMNGICTRGLKFVE